MTPRQIFCVWYSWYNSCGNTTFLIILLVIPIYWLVITLKNFSCLWISGCHNLLGDFDRGVIISQGVSKSPSHFESKRGQNLLILNFGCQGSKSPVTGDFMLKFWPFSVEISVLRSWIIFLQPSSCNQSFFFNYFPTNTFFFIELSLFFSQTPFLSFLSFFCFLFIFYEKREERKKKKEIIDGGPPIELK